MTNFLPKGYESLKTEKAYWKMSQMEDGDNRLRIVSQPIAGWLDWEDKKPMRYKPENKPKAPFNAEKPIKAFWSCYVWDYKRQGLYVLEITQSTILKALTMIATDSDWGDFTKYDIKITKEGTGKETRYSLTPIPPKPLDPAIVEALKKTPVRLEALYEGKDPWTDLEDFGFDRRETNEQVSKEPEKDMDILKKKMEEEKINPDHLDEYFKARAASTKQTMEELIKAALLPDFFNRFKDVYLKYLSKKVGQVA